MTPLERARKIFSDDLFATQLTGISLDSIDYGSATCSLVLDSSHRNAVGAVMGGVVFTLADLSFAAAANSEAIIDTPDGEKVTLPWVSTSSHIVFLAASKGSRLYATASRIRQGHTQSVFEISVNDDMGHQIASVTSIGNRVSPRHTPNDQ